MSNVEDEGFAQRVVASFFEKFERYESQELLGHFASHWLLSSDDYKVPTEPPSGLITQLQTVNECCTILLVPVEDDVPALDMREVHQLIRELTLGIYGMNQMPVLHLEANVDQSTSCQLPPAYFDTRVGQLMINVDYMMKGLWHGAYFPHDKRLKFSERWKSSLDIDPSTGRAATKKPFVNEFTSAGLKDISTDPSFSTIFDNLPKECASEKEISEEQSYFMQYANDLSMQITFYQQCVHQYKNIFLVDANWSVSSMVKLADDKIEKSGYERLHARLQLHELLIEQNLTTKPETRHQLYLLKLVSFLVPFLVAMKKRMRVPNIATMLPNMIGDDIKTCRELPPLILPQDYKCKNFIYSQKEYFHIHGGISIAHETPSPEEAGQSLIDQYGEIVVEAVQLMSQWGNPNAKLKEEYPIPIREIDGKKYYCFGLEFETFYPQMPQKPKWVQLMYDEVIKLRPKRLPLSDMHLHDMFKQFFGIKQAIKCKNLHIGLKSAASRGLISMFMTLIRKSQGSRLGKQDEMGYNLIHYASMYNRHQIVALLILQSIDVNVRRNTNLLSTGYVPSNKRTGPTPLHFAARCGALDTVACLLANYANILATDQDGWAPVHCAAYFNHEHILMLMIRKNEALLELQTKNELHSTPLLLAASAGALASVKCLIELGAYILRRDDDGSNIIHQAALRFHTNILEFFIEWNHPEVKVWDLLVEMLVSTSMKKKECAVKCLEVMSSSDPQYWKAILDSKGIPALVKLLSLNNEEIQVVTASVLCNISAQEDICLALTDAEAGPVLIKLLSSPVDDIQSRAAVVLSDLACVKNNQSDITSQGAVEPLVSLLDSNLEDVLVNAVNALRVLCEGNPENQTMVARSGAIDPLVEFLSVTNSDILQSASAAAISALTDGHTENQMAVMQEGAVEPIVKLIKCRNMTVQMKASMALESMSKNNRYCQECFLQLDAPKALMNLFIKVQVWSMEVKEQAALALWSLSGSTPTQRRYIGERMGIATIIDMLLLSSEKLQYVGALGMSALVFEDADNQNLVAKQGGLSQLVRLLRSQKTSLRVLVMIIKALGTLCKGVAHRNNKVTQRAIAEENALRILVQLFLRPPNQSVQVEVAYTIGCIVLGNHENQEILMETNFSYLILVDLLNGYEKEISLKAGFALAIFAFNNTTQQYTMKEAGGMRFDVFRRFLESDDPEYVCNAAFQIVVLARVIVDRDQVKLTADGVKTLVDVVKTGPEDAVVLAVSLLASLAHTRAGITDAMLTLGILYELIDRLYSENEQIRFSCAVALGYLTYNRTASRQLMTACRNTPGLYDLLMANIGKNYKISKEFVDEYSVQKIVGMPCLSLEANGGPPVVPPSRRGERPHTIHGGSLYSDSTSNKRDRIMSAPAGMHRAQSATSSRVKSASTVGSKRMAMRSKMCSDLVTSVQTASKEDSFIKSKSKQAWSKK